MRAREGEGDKERVGMSHRTGCLNIGLRSMKREVRQNERARTEVGIREELTLT
jgi:hypothetical protein